MPTDDNVIAALRLAVSGDRVAFQKLLLSHHDRLVASIAAKLPTDQRGSGLADDVVQEAYVVAFREIGSFDPESGSAGFFAWLCRIGEYRMRDILKGLRAAKRGGGRAAVSPTGSDADESEMIGLLDLLSAHSRTPSRSAARYEAAAAVHAAMEKLEPEHHEALRLRYLDGLPVAEVALRLDRSEGAAIMLCNRGLKRLREILGDSVRFLSRKE